MTDAHYRLLRRVPVPGCDGAIVNEPITIDHPKLVKLLQMAYSAEKAAAFAYIGHAGSVKNPDDKAAIQQIEVDEWHHREAVLAIMTQYGIQPSRYNEIKYHVIGRILSASCYVIGWFMPYYFAGRLESGNVCEYFIMMRYFNDLGITAHDDVLYEMGMKEKEHEVYFQKALQDNRLLPLFERIFGWGNTSSFNDVDLENKAPVEGSKGYCKHRP
jgi:rubrerythrin